MLKILLKLIRLHLLFNSAFLDALRYTLFDGYEIREVEMKCSRYSMKEETMLVNLDASLDEAEEE